MRIDGTIEISGADNPDVTLDVADNDDVITLALGGTGGKHDAMPTAMNLAEARKLRSLLGIAISAAEHNISDFDS